MEKGQQPGQVYTPDNNQQESQEQVNSSVQQQTEQSLPVNNNQPVPQHTPPQAAPQQPAATQPETPQPETTQTPQPSQQPTTPQPEVAQTPPTQPAQQPADPVNNTPAPQTQPVQPPANPQSSTSNEVNDIDDAMRQNTQPEIQDEAPESYNSQTDQLQNGENQNFAYTEGVNTTESNQETAGEPQTTQNVPGNEQDEGDPDRELLAWRAAEPTETGHKNMKAILVTSVLAIAIIAAAILISGFTLSTITTILVVVTAVTAVIMTSRQHNHLVDYAIYDNGVVIGGKYYAFQQLRSFSIISRGNTDSIELEPAQRFMIRLVMHLDSSTAEQVVELLKQKLPYEEKEESFTDRFSEFLKL